MGAEFNAVIEHAGNVVTDWRQRNFGVGVLTASGVEDGIFVVRRDDAEVVLAFFGFHELSVSEVLTEFRVRDGVTILPMIVPALCMVASALNQWISRREWRGSVVGGFPDDGSNSNVYDVA